MAKAAKPSEKVDIKAPSPDPFEKIAKDAFGSEHGPHSLRLLNQIVQTTRIKADQDARIQAMLALVGAIKGLKPSDEIESMLVTQMIATHEQAMECLRRATLPDQDAPDRDLNLKYAGKFLQTYARQVEALDKHRGKGQQKIIVEHVTVEAGGQAIVGNVATAPSPASLVQPAQPKAISHTPDDSVSIGGIALSSKEPVPVRRQSNGDKSAK